MLRKHGRKGLQTSAILAMAFIVTACGSSQPEDNTPGEQTDEVTIQYWHINSETLGANAIRETISRFNELHPNITVEAEFQGNYGELMNNLQASIAGGSPPDIAQIGYNFRQYVLTNLPHVPVSDFADTDPEYGEFIDGFIDGILNLGQDADGMQRAIPLAISSPLMYYNADLFREAGLDPEAPPQTWEEVREAALIIREKTGEYGLGLQTNAADNWLPQSLIESNGGWIIDPDGQVAVNQPEVEEVYRFWQELALVDRSLPVITDAEQEQAFAAGRLGMYVKTSAALSNFIDLAAFELRTASFPSWGDQDRRLASGGNALFIFSQDEAKQRAAYEFLKFVSSKEGQTIWVKDTGYLPLVKDVEDDPQYLQGYFEENTLILPAQEQLAHSVPWLPMPGDRGLEAERVLIEARESILNGADVQQTLQEANDSMKRVLGLD